MVAENDQHIALAETAGDVVGHRELMDRAWPNVVVTEGSLRVTIAALRKDLGDGQRAEIGSRTNN